MLVADARLRELVPGEPSEEASQPRSRKARKNRGSGSKRLPARVVLRRIWPEGYPPRAEVSDADLWDRFVKEWDRVEGKRPPTKFNKIPSNSTVLRETGRKD
jgi:hypothetical protein